MEGLQYFDCNAQVGRRGYKHPEQLWRTEDVLAEMDRAGIAGALVWHGMCKLHGPLHGNRRLLEELRKSPRLFGCWVVLPDHLGDFPSPDDLIAEMRTHGIRAAKMYPKTHNFETDDITVGKLLTSLERERIPLLVESGEADWTQLKGILSGWPALPVVLQDLHWMHQRRLFAFMDAYENLHIEFSQFQANEIIEIAYRRFGAERLLFGSGMPLKSPGAGRAFIDYARIPIEAKRWIAGGNLARLTGIAPPHAPMPDWDEVTRKASRGLPIDIPVLDSHTHLIEDGGGVGGWPMIGGDIDSMIALYRTMGVRKMSIAPWIGINGGDAETGNLVAELAKNKYPDEVEAYVRLDPNYGEDVEVKAKEWHLEKKFKGMKPYYYNDRIAYTDKIYEPWWTLANRLRCYALVDPAIQSHEEYMRQIDELATKYPEVSIFMDHGGRSFEVAQDYAKIARKHPNVSIQLTITLVTLGVIEFLVREVGAEKVLFGTDSPMRDPRPQVGWVAYANLPIEEKKLVFGGNFQRILDRCLIQ